MSCCYMQSVFTSGLLLMEMNFKLVLLERVDGNNIIANSGLLIDNKFIIATTNIFGPEIGIEKQWSQVKTTKNLHLNPIENKSVVINCVIANDDGTYKVEKVHVFAAYFSNSVKRSDIVLKHFKVDSLDNNTNVLDSLSTFYILTFDPNCTLEELKLSLKRWWDLVGWCNIQKCHNVYIESSAFANRNFLNSVSRGIVSNILGEHRCLILSDCPTTPGSEGSPVFIGKNENDFRYPVGIVLSSVSFWRGEWTGLTIILDIRTILIDIIDHPVRILSTDKDFPSHLVIANSEYSVVQIYSGGSWGTAILLDSKQGIFLTNSHVIIENEPSLFYKSKKFLGKVIYQVPDSSDFDLAIIQCTEILSEKLKAISVSKKECKIGQTVYSVGFPFFPKECLPTPTVTKGCIAKKHKMVLKTTCSVHGGSSGGAILDENGYLVGIIVCNTKLNNHAIFPRINLAIPYATIADVIENYLQNMDLPILKKLEVSRDIATIWNLEGKL